MANIALIAPPGGGKGTQSEKLIAELKIVHISTGDIFRGIKNGTYQASGKLNVPEIQATMQKGELIKDDIVIGVVMDRLSKPDCQNGYLLDGFPRTMAQAEAFDQLASKEKKLQTVFLLEVNEDGLIKRLTGRRTCSKCGKIYNVYYTPPKIEGKCDDDASELTLRSDDNVETVTKRLSVYKEETSPLIGYYQKKGILHRVNGDQAVGKVFSDIMEVMKR
jgi:adenylate kinase